MRKVFFLLIITFISTDFIFAQAPQSFQYQAVIRDASGNVLQSQSVNFKLSIISGSVSGTVEYVENHNSVTNQFGIVTLNVGLGLPVTGIFSSINWSASSHFIKVEADPAGGTSYLDMGTTQLLSVPYALYAETSGNAGQTYTSGSGIDITGNVITNTAPDQTVNLTQAGATTITGTYPNFTISSTDNNSTYTAGTGINLTGTTITNTSPDQTVSLTQGGATTISGTYPNFTISSTDLNSGTPGGLNKTIQFNNSGTFGGNTNFVWDNSNERLGVGTTSPLGRMVVQGSATALATEPLFEVKNKAGQTVFVVYEDSVNVYVNDDAIQSNRGGFAVSGRNNSKAITNNYLRVTPDNTRIHTGDSLTGFGVSDLNGGPTANYMQMTPKNYFIGHEAGKELTLNTANTGKYNSFIGYQSGYSNTSGIKNYFIGYRSGFNNLSGNSNIFIGDSVGYSNTSGFKNIFIGNSTGFANTNGYSNVFMGHKSGYSNISGYDNVFIGDHAGYGNTIGFYNVYIGYNTGYSTTSGSYNTAQGYKSLYSNTTGETNTATGFQALQDNTTGSNNIAIGVNAMQHNNTGFLNLAIGNYSLNNNFDGYSNVAFGSYALWVNNNGYQNTAIGSGSLYNNSSGYYNTSVGASTLNQNITGFYNTALGYNSNVISDGLSNTTALGFNAMTTASNQVRIGNWDVTSIGGFTDWSNISDKRFKKDIKNNVPGLDFILKLEPVTYHLDIENIANYFNSPDSIRIKDSEIFKGNILQTGFIAQDVEKAANELGFDFSGVDKPKNKNDFYGLRYAEFTVPLVKAVQELNEKLIKENEEQKIVIEKLIQRIEKIENNIK
ncbi:MAG: tail fiber domain-containing protein [Bacteroidia bacterium]|nr:tail fiber domain-containing protein [Bacteroidia bacterium]